MAEHEQPELLVCTGKACRKAKGHQKLVLLAVDHAGSLAVPCQGICDGPVVGIRTRRGVRWFRRVRGKHRAALKRMFRTGKGRGALRTAEVKRRRDELRHPARARRLLRER